MKKKISPVSSRLCRSEREPPFQRTKKTHHDGAPICLLVQSELFTLMTLSCMYIFDSETNAIQE